MSWDQENIDLLLRVLSNIGKSLGVTMLFSCKRESEQKWPPPDISYHSGESKCCSISRSTVFMKITQTLQTQFFKVMSPWWQWLTSSRKRKNGLKAFCSLYVPASSVKEETERIKVSFPYNFVQIFFLSDIFIFPRFDKAKLFVIINSFLPLIVLF